MVFERLAQKTSQIKSLYLKTNWKVAHYFSLWWAFIIITDTSVYLGLCWGKGNVWKGPARVGSTVRWCWPGLQAAPAISSCHALPHENPLSLPKKYFLEAIMVYRSTRSGVAIAWEGNSPAMGGEGMGSAGFEVLLGSPGGELAVFLYEKWRVIVRAAFCGATSCSGEDKVELTPPKLPWYYYSYWNRAGETSDLPQAYWSKH